MRLKIGAACLLFLVQLSAAGCGPGAGRKPFLDQKKSIPAGKEWGREIASARGGNVVINVKMPG